MSSEAQTWSDHIRPVMVAARLDPHRIENAVSLGMPDVNYLYGWIELKYKHEWPKREDTPLRLPHFTAEQQVFLWRRTKLKGLAFLLLRVDKEFMLFDGVTAKELRQFQAKEWGLPRASLIEKALAYSPKGFDYHTFVPRLIGK